ncbi:23S rRNA (guanosine(2251)-2'-O)-methyltransferase RlmB [Natronoglycomyces albus]|uniref:23S rRNA (Guanosine(2251)-2'-O)-methyltransferase RlmB n=1 Tax=Natronoglycomyces albus TaxID=2811108 RepID=A0A895XQI8_9ACTN|nr:23S rRNA (guanosine(2251)-2'-O)-methyltransferase RlmB [Natronoglycomyces albus]QSB04826.1 23S rRNA (guanosine(2251)-2'-O)-methyltransferase RlmB [Natronoglycomyces albus]
MAKGNSERPGKRKQSKAGSKKGSGGQKKGLQPQGRSLKAEDRPWHKSYTGEDKPQRTQWKQEKERRKAAEEGRVSHIGKAKPRNDRRKRSHDALELLVGRNPVVEALRASVPSATLFVAEGIDSDDRVAEAVRVAHNRGLEVREVPRAELDRRTKGAMHQGLGLEVEPFEYLELPDLIEEATAAPEPALLVALDGVTDPRNLGAIVRSTAAFGGHGLAIPTRRASGMTAVAWRSSAGAAARLPIARVVNMTRAVKDAQQAGIMTVALDGEGDTELYDLPVASDPILLVVGDEGRGVSRLVSETVDFRVRIPIASETESLNASVAASVALSEIRRQRAINLG